MTHLTDLPGFVHSPPPAQRPVPARLGRAPSACCLVPRWGHGVRPNRGPGPGRFRPPRGFTLVEVMVALAVVAIALSAGLQASGAMTRAAERQTDQWLAELCADNALLALRLLPTLPPVGDNGQSCEQGGRVLQMRVSVQPTPNPNFRRIDAVVFDDQGRRLLNTTTVQGRY